MEPASAERPGVDQLREAIQADDAECARRMLEANPELRSKLNEPLGPFDSPTFFAARSREMLDVLLAAGADLNAKSRWWAGGFGFLHSADPDLAAYAIERGGAVDIHAAARLGLVDRLRELVESDPQLVHARGGDGQTPLHFARTVEIAAYLLGHGADIDARDIDHESTPAQYMLDDRPEVARYLVQQGCTTDLLLAAAVGDLDLVRKHLDTNPECIRLRASEEHFPMTNKKAGGTIYFWVLGPGATVYQAAAKFGHHDVLKLLMDRSPPEAKLIAACWLHDRTTVTALLGEHPGLVGRLSNVDRNEIAVAARNNNTAALSVMLEAGLPVTARGQHRGTPLHWASWHGNLAMVQALLPFGPPLEDAENDFHATPLGWAAHGSEHGWHRRTGDYPAVVEALLKAGANVPETPVGSDAVKTVMRRFASKD
jgi:ankyrin repeat protein